MTLFSELSGLREAQLVPSMNFFELGLDSLFLTQAAASIQKTFGVMITFRELLEERTTIEMLADRVAERLPRVPAGERSADGPRRGVMTSGDVGPIIRQLDALRAQLESFMDASGGATAPTREPVNARPPAAVEGPRESAPPSPGAAAPENRGFGPIRPEKGSAGVSADQKRSLDKFVEAYASLTRESKRLTAAHRGQLADPRSVAGFRSIWKEIVPNRSPPDPRIASVGWTATIRRSVNGSGPTCSTFSQRLSPRPSKHSPLGIDWTAIAARWSRGGDGRGRHPARGLRNTARS